MLNMVFIRGMKEKRHLQSLRYFLRRSHLSHLKALLAR